MANPHDRFFRETFRHLDEARGLLRSALPSHVSALIQWHTLARIDRSFIDPDLTECHTDHLFTVRIGHRLVLLYVLCEHKWGIDLDLPFQLLRDEVRIWEDWRREHPNGPLPPILPYVLYHGDRPWTGPLRLQERIGFAGMPDAAAQLLRHLLPDAGFLLDDLAAQSDSDLEARAMSAIARISVLAMRNLPGRPPDVVAAAIARWQQTIAAALRQRGQEGLLLLWSYLYQTPRPSPKRWPPPCRGRCADDWRQR